MDYEQRYIVHYSYDRSVVAKTLRHLMAMIHAYFVHGAADLQVKIGRRLYREYSTNVFLDMNFRKRLLPHRLFVSKPDSKR